MSKIPARLLVCNCRGSMRIDGAKLSTALGLAEPLVVHRELCRAQMERFEAALGGAGPLLVACTQEVAAFSAVVEERGAEPSRVRFTNIREHAGWSSDPADLTPKMAALLAEAGHVPTPARLMTMTSTGRCLVYGSGPAALDAAALLAKQLDITVLLTDAAGALPPLDARGAIATGMIRAVTGHLGAFAVEISNYAPALPSSRGALEFAPPAATARTTADLIVDLSGRAALFSDSARRDGYIRIDPNRPDALARGLLAAADLVGEFEKPLYVAYDTDICAHSRSSKAGCNKCLDVCPTGAIAPSGDHVAITPEICAGCGACAAVCPTGAIGYSYPERGDLVARLGLLLSTYLAAGGTRPQLLIHDASHGTPLIAALARFGAGLPANVLPLEVYSVATIGHDTLATAIAMGAEHVALLADPQHAVEHASIATEVELVGAILSGLLHEGPRAHLLAIGDPDALDTALAALPVLATLPASTFMAAGSKRDFARGALSKLHASAPAPVDRISLPVGAPYGRIAVKIDGCTLCLACVGACPANALADNPDKPELSFTEAACVQCGICVSTCPEQVISLEPGYDFTPAALGPRILKSEAPFHCVSCNKPFGAKSTIDRVIAKLEGKHAMFKNPAQVRLIQMCDTCRVVALSELGNDPMRLGERPRVRTTDDYLAEAKAAAAPSKKTPDDFMT